MGTHLDSDPEAFWRAFWGMLFLTGGAVDVWRMTRHDGTTLSNAIRYAFGTDSTLGKARFLAALGVLAVHILHKS